EIGPVRPLPRGPVRHRLCVGKRAAAGLSRLGWPTSVAVSTVPAAAGAQGKASGQETPAEHGRRPALSPIERRSGAATSASPWFGGRDSRSGHSHAGALPLAAVHPGRGRLNGETLWQRFGGGGALEFPITGPLDGARPGRRAQRGPG